MKTLLCCCAVILSNLSLMAESPQATPVAIAIDVPSPAWSLKITSIHTKADKLLVVCNAQKKEGMAAAVMSKAKDSVNIPSQYAKLPREVYVTGQKWNYSNGYKAVTTEELKKHLTGATEIYSAKKSLTKESFIGLTIDDAHALAQKNNHTSRVVEIDGNPQATTRDMRPNRFNFAIKEGKVIRVTKG